MTAPDTIRVRTERLDHRGRVTSFEQEVGIGTSFFTYMTGQNRARRIEFVHDNGDVTTYTRIDKES